MITTNGKSPLDSPQHTTSVTMVPLTEGAASPNKNDDEFKIRPHQLWAAFCRHWLLSITLGVLAALPVAYLAWKYVPTPYVAQSQIRMLASRQKIGFDLPEDRENFKVLKSREMQRVKHPHTIEAALHNIDSALQSQGQEQADEEKQEQEAPQRLPTKISELSFFQNLPPGMDHRAWLRTNLSVRNTGDETFAIALEGEFPRELKLIVDSVSRAYLARQEQQLTGKSRERKGKLDLEISGVADDITEKMEIIKDLASELEGSTGDAKEDLANQSEILKISEIQGEIRQIDRELIDLRGQLQAILGTPESDRNEPPTDRDEPATIPEGSITSEQLDQAITYDERYLSLATRINRIERKIKLRKDTYNSANLPEIKDLIRQLEAAKEGRIQLEATLRKEYQKSIGGGGGDDSLQLIQYKIAALEKYKEGLEKELSQIRVVAQSRIRVSVELDMERAALQELQELKQSLEAQRRSLQIERETINRIFEDIKAEVPDQRETKKRNMVASAGGFGTFGFVVALFTLLELRFMRVSSLKTLEEEFEFPILGTIPRLPVKVLQNQKNSRKAVVYKHTFTEAIDSARMVLLNQNKRSQTKIIMVTSALGGEGKSTLSSHLAISFARAGKKTLLIDGDLRRPRVHDVFGIPDFPGFCEALRGETCVEKCIYESGVTGLDIMPAGELDAFTLSVLAEAETQEVFVRLRDEYDLVLFDSSPILPVADSLLIMQSIDGVLLSIRKDHSRISKVAAALKKIDLVGGKVLGGIVIGISEAEYGGQNYYGKTLAAETVSSGSV